MEIYRSQHIIVNIVRIDIYTTKICIHAHICPSKETTKEIVKIIATIMSQKTIIQINLIGKLHPLELTSIMYLSNIISSCIDTSKNKLIIPYVQVDKIDNNVINTKNIFMRLCKGKLKDIEIKQYKPPNILK